MIPLNLNERLKECRKNKKLTQEQLAKMININRSTYAKYETGENEPDAAMLDILANFFNVSVDYLLGRTDNPNPINNQEEDTPISIAFSHGGEGLTEDELEHLEQELKRYRELKARFMREKNRDN